MAAFNWLRSALFPHPGTVPSASPATRHTSFSRLSPLFRPTRRVKQVRAICLYSVYDKIARVLQASRKLGQPEKTKLGRNDAGSPAQKRKRPWTETELGRGIGRR